MNIKKVLVIFLMSFALSSVFALRVKEGSFAPDFTVETMDGKLISLSEFKGKALVLHFWATWCPPCKVELPEMENLHKEIQAKGENSKLNFLAICISDSKKNCIEFMEKNKYTFLTAIDEKGISATLYGIQGVPCSILISPEGKIVDIHIGRMTKSQIEYFVKDYVQ